MWADSSIVIINEGRKLSHLACLLHPQFNLKDISLVCQQWSETFHRKINVKNINLILAGRVMMEIYFELCSSCSESCHEGRR